MLCRRPASGAFQTGVRAPPDHLLRDTVRCALPAQRHICSIFIWLNLILLSYYGGRSGAKLQVVCPTPSTVAFFENLANTSCDVILINGRGFVLSHQEVAAILANEVDHRLVLGRNVILRGEANNTVLDMAYLKRRILIHPGLVLRVENLVLVHVRQPSATSQAGLDILSAEEGSQVIMKDSIIVYGMCLPSFMAYKYTSMVQRPSIFPGNQSATLLQGPDSLCIFGLKSLTAVPQVGNPQGLQVASDCWDEAFVMYDFAMEGTRMDPQSTRIRGGDVHYKNVSYVCEHMPPPSCWNVSNGTATSVILTCTQQLIDKLGLRVWDTFDLVDGTSGSSSGPDNDKETPVLAIVLPCVLGGVALIALVVGGRLWWRRRERRWEAHQAGSPVAAKGSSSLTQNGVYASPASEAAKGMPCPKEAVLAPQGVLMQAEEGANGAGSNGHARTGSGNWAHAGTPKSPACSTGKGKVPALNGSYPSGNTSMPPMVRSGTMSSVQSASMTGTNFTCGAPGGPAGLFAAMPGGPDVLLGNPLLGGPPGSAHGSGTGIALNMVLGVDVLASREAVLGRGTFATVLEGHLNGRPVAVKMFHRDALGSTEDDVKSLQQEIAILARCQHPNVVALLGAGSTTGGEEVFLVEELMVTNLARLCHEGGGMPLHQVLAVARDIAAGLAYLHPTVIHRDLKPANVLLDPYGTAKLTDFGLSRLWASTVHTANPEAGTVQYMAPECFSGSLTDLPPGKIAISHLSDIYSFGVLLWEMLAKERPWRGLTSIQVALAVGFQHQRLKVPDSDSERFHPKLRKLILQCWETDPRKRPGAAEIAKRLSLLLQQLGTHGSLSPPAPAPASFTGSSSGEGQGSVSAAAPVSSGSLGPGSAVLPMPEVTPMSPVKGGVLAVRETHVLPSRAGGATVGAGAAPPPPPSPATRSP